MPRGQAPGKKNTVKYPNTNTLAGASLAARKARDKARKEKAAAKARAEEFGSDMSPTMTAYEKSKARAVAVKRSASITAGDGKPDPKKLANPKTKPKTEGDSRYRPGKGGVGDARYRPGAGSVTAQLAQSGMKVTKKPSTSNANASTSTPKKKDTPSVSMPKSRPKRTTSTASKSSYDEVKPQKRKGTSSYDEVKPQKKTAKKPTKTKTPTTKSRDKDGLGKQSKTVVPKGAVPFNGSIDKKTHKLRNINGKTYKVKK